MTITLSQLQKLCPNNNKGNLQSVVDAINKVCPLYGINTPDIMHEFMARLLVETGEFTTFSESLNYSVQGLIDNFGRHRISIEDARKYGRTLKRKADQQSIANILYGGKWGLENLGNTEPNDGWELRGSGAIQTTGRRNISKFGEYMRKRFGIIKNTKQWAEALRNDMEYSMHSACYIFAISMNLIDEAIDDNLKAIVKRINGGLKGMNETQKYYEKCKAVIV